MCLTLYLKSSTALSQHTAFFHAVIKFLLKSSQRVDYPIMLLLKTDLGRATQERSAVICSARPLTVAQNALCWGNWSMEVLWVDDSASGLSGDEDAFLGAHLWTPFWAATGGGNCLAGSEEGPSNPVFCSQVAALGNSVGNNSN